MTSSLAPRHGRLYRRMAADAAALRPRPGPGGLVRTRWSTPVEGWMKVSGRWQPHWGAAIWHLPEGPFCYAEFGFTPGAVRYNVTPAELAVRERDSQPPGGERLPGRPAAAGGSRP